MTISKNPCEVMAHKKLKKMMHYEPETGVFTRLVDSSRGRIGKITNVPQPTGYIIIRFSG